jgi:hypothetical protein
MHDEWIGLVCAGCKDSSSSTFFRRFRSCAGCAKEDDHESWWVVSVAAHQPGDLSAAMWHGPFYWQRALFEMDEMRRLSWRHPKQPPDL